MTMGFDTTIASVTADCKQTRDATMAVMGELSHSHPQPVEHTTVTSLGTLVLRKGEEGWEVLIDMSGRTLTLVNYSPIPTRLVYSAFEKSLNRWLEVYGFVDMPDTLPDRPEFIWVGIETLEHGVLGNFYRKLFSTMLEG